MQGQQSCSTIKPILISNRKSIYNIYMSFLDEYPKQNNLRTGYMGNLTERQQSEFDLLKASVKTNEYIDELNVFPQPGWFILRFLRATMKDKTGLRIFQAVPAEERLIGTLKWRRENNTSQIRDNLRNNKLPATFETYLRDIRPRMTWIDKSGRPVTLEKLGLYAQHVQLDVFTEKEWEVNCIYDLERILLTFDEQSALLGVEVGTKITIFDLDGIGLGAVSRIKILKMLSAMMGTHYPELA